MTTFIVDVSGLWPQAVRRIGGLAFGGEAWPAPRKREFAPSRKARKRREKIRNIAFMIRLLFRGFGSFSTILTKSTDKVKSLEIFPLKA
jgi:hypothetical protein